MRWRNKKDERYGYYGSFQAPGVENMGDVLCRRDTGQCRSDSLVRDPLGRIVHTDRLCRCFIGPALCRCRRSAVGRVGREEVGLPQVQVG